MNQVKAPSPNGIPALFSQNHWIIVGPRIVSLVHNVFHSDRILKAANDTCVILVPKVIHISLFMHLLPISLCNTLYKTFLSSWLYVSSIFLIKLFLPLKLLSSLEGGLGRIMFLQMR